MSKVVVLVPNLFFLTRIQTVARELGVPMVAADPGRAPEVCRVEQPRLVIADLQAEGVLEAVREIRGDPATAGVRIVGFYSHVEGAIRDAALAAGVTEVMPRSAFTVKLADLMKG